MALPLDQRVFVPHGIPDLFSIMKRRPDCLIWAGGTYIGTSPIARLDARSRDLISLHRIEELTRIFRTDRYLELGATVTLDRILRLSDRLTPPSLKQAILATVPAPARSLATIGGNLCIPHELLTLLPWAAAIDARLEIRRQGAVRFIAAGKLMNSLGEPALDIGEVLTRIRIPIGRWNHQVFRRIERDEATGSPALAICGLAAIHKDVIEDIRICHAFSNSQWHVWAPHDAELIGQRLPLSAKVISTYAALVSRSLLAVAPGNDELLVYRIAAVVDWYLRSLPSNIE
jgi:CO/xanthine dehydrogenase FAD-binding subunit